MLEFTISLNDSQMEFMPMRDKPDLALLFPPTARVGRTDDNVHLDPVPVHCFFNAVAMGQWLAGRNRLSSRDGAFVYLLHDIFKPLMVFGSAPNGKRSWEHLTGFAQIESALKNAGIFGEFDRAFQIISLHMLRGPLRQASLEWSEITWHEQGLTDQGRQQAETIGLSIGLHPALSNMFALELIKQLFVSAYTEAVRHEYREFFDGLDEITYRYKFIDPSGLSGDANRDIARLCRDSVIALADRQLVIEVPIGATRPPDVPSDAATRMRIPFWLLLTIYADPTGIIFPVPSLPDDSPNLAFIECVKATFYRRVKKLLDQVPGTARRWEAKKAEIIKHLDGTLAVHAGKYETVRAALAATTASGTECNLCGSQVSEDFVCSPESDLGWSTSHYTDWHQGNIESTCVLCAISNFKIPRALEPANKLVKQKKVVYLSVSTPNISGYTVRFDDASRKSVLPFFDAAIKPKLVPSSLESLVTLNLLGALFLHASVRAARVETNGKGELWLKSAMRTSPFTFVGEIGKRQSKREVVALLSTMHAAFSRGVTLIDPMMQVAIEVPFASLTCIMGNTKGKHYELKFKPLQISNKTGTLPIVCDSFHLADAETLTAVGEVQSLVRTLRGKGVSDSMKVSALASSPADLVDVMTNVGGCNIETVLNHLAALARGEEPLSYLERVRTLIHKYPLVTELWR